MACLKLEWVPSTRDAVINYLKILKPDERERLKCMVEHGAFCASGIAELYNITPEEFNAELRNIFNETILREKIKDMNKYKV